MDHSPVSPGSDEYRRRVGDRYLVLHRENYLREAGDVRDFLLRLANDLRLDEVRVLLASRDWRDKVVGVYVAVVRPDPELLSEVAGMLGDRAHRAVWRAACVVLASHPRPWHVEQLRGFLKPPLDPDCLDDYCAACGALEAICPAEVKPSWNRIAAEFSQKEFFTADCLEDSRTRFLSAVEFWRMVRSRS